MDTNKAEKAAKLLEQKMCYTKTIKEFEEQQETINRIRMLDSRGSHIGNEITDEMFINEITNWHLSMLKATLNHINLQIMAL